jgi:hypothetical protein
MAFDFPSSPTVGQIFSPITGVNYSWNGYAWDRQIAVTPLAPSGTAMLFQQTSAPTGWTKQTTHNDKSLRIVSGTAGAGGTLAFSTVFGRTTSDGFTLTTNEIPPHAHTVTDPTHTHTVYDPGHAHSIADPGHGHTNAAGQTYWTAWGGQYFLADGSYVPAAYDQWGIGASGTGIGIYGAGVGVSNYGAATGVTLANAGAGASHSHGMDTRVLYVDAIIATKD